MSKNRYYGGIDVGTSYIKVVIIDEKGELAGSFIERTSADLQRSINNAFQGVIISADISRDLIKSIAATGFGRQNVSFANREITEISSHAKGVYYYFPKKITLIDIGGQDTKIIKIDKLGKIISFKMNRKCAAGTGSFLEEIAYKLNISISEMNKLAYKSSKESALSSYCTVFASTEILTRIKEGEKIEDMIKSVFESIVKRVIEMDILTDVVIITGGVIAYNDIILKILEKYIGRKIFTPPNPQFSGAFGASLFAKAAKC
jgi:predicted CoA-substrate-specific enzyme activase